MSELDFSGIEPARVPEVKRRLYAIRAYLDAPTQNGEATIRLAQSIGLTRYQFQRLVRVWRDHRNPAMLVIGKRGPATRDYGIDPRAKIIAGQFIESMGEGSTSNSIVNAVMQQCTQTGIKLPSQATIYNWIKQHRAKDSQGLGLPSIAIGRVWPRLVVSGHENAFPLLLVAVALPEKTILAHRISFDPERPASAGALMHELLQKCSPEAMPRRLLIGPHDLRVSAEPLRNAGATKLKSHSLSLQRLMSRTFGHRLADMPIVFQIKSARKSAAAILSRQDEPISESVATTVIEYAIDMHNRRRDHPVGLFYLQAEKTK